MRLRRIIGCTSSISRWLAAALLISSLPIGVAHGATVRTVVNIVGDQDALGTGTAPGGNLPSGPFDNRSAAELAAIDGSENTDFATVGGGLARDVTFVHTFSITGWRQVGMAVLELGIGAMQTNDNDFWTARREEDALRVDGLLLYNSFAGVDQGPRGYGIVRIVLPAMDVPEWFEDGELQVSIDLNSFGGTGPSNRVEPVFYDFSRLTLTEIPEPSTAFLLLAGATLFLPRNPKERRARRSTFANRGCALPASSLNGGSAHQQEEDTSCSDEVAARLR